MSDPHVMLFDPYVGGHHGQHIQQILRHWHRMGLSGKLDIVVPQNFVDVHAELGVLIERLQLSGVRFVPMPRSFSGAATSTALIKTDYEIAKLLTGYVESLRPDHCMLMFFDRVQLPLATGLRFSYPVRLSGTYFRPSFHYTALGRDRRSLRETMRDGATRLLLKAALRNPHFDTLFCLDPYVIPYVSVPRKSVRLIPLPDGIEQDPPAVSRTEVRRRYDIEPGRKLLLFFGALDRRKGTFEVLEALQSLADDEGRQAAVLFAGKITPHERELVHAKLADLRASSSVQIVLDDTFIEESLIQSLFSAADLALVPYQKHIGSSGILVRAAHAGVPVLGSNYGMMGATIRAYKLGYSVDSTRAEEVRQALGSFLTDPGSAPFSPGRASEFAQENTAEKMAATWLSHLGFGMAAVPN